MAGACVMRAIHFAPDGVASAIPCHARITDLLSLPCLIEQFRADA